MKLETIADNWQELNKNYLMQELARIQKKLYDKIASTEQPSIKAQSFDLDEIELSKLISSFAVEIISDRFDLSPFEKDILLLCAGMELDRAWGLLCGQAQGSDATNYPTFSLALSTLDSAHWDALTPNAPLRHWRLIELQNNSNSLTTKELVIDEQILHYLLGIRHLDERLTGLLDLVTNTPSLVPSHQKIVDKLAQIWLQTAGIPIINLYGQDSSSKKAIAAAISEKLQLDLYTISAEILPSDTSQLYLFKCLLERDWLLNQSAFFLDCDYWENNERSKDILVSLLLDNLRCPLTISSQERRRERHKSLITVEVKKPTTQEQRLLWSESLGDIIPEYNGKIDTLVSYFNLNLPAIESVCLQLKSTENNGYNHSDLNDRLWQMCRTQARPHLEQLAQRIDSNVTWEDLILPESELNILRELATHVRHKEKVYHHWGFAQKNARGLGISALFAGASGTGKTLAAEVLGNELQLDVYRIDLSAVVSKYIGETEKNLKKIFDAAEGCGAILLFDEADALFGKRSEVKDSHDRYANMEVSYLLQRIESYQGLAILTTNLKDDLDRAFLRRIRFIAQFPFPDFSQRSAIWQRIFPLNTPTQDLNFEKLAKLNVAGGNIRNIAINAAFLAANSQESVQMKHILQAAQSEYSKLEKPLTDNEVKGWI
ncbi:MAG: ATP-binding protein [Xenococcaceae cyanobacterium MO_188.B29]|nr:ATP-binding protein [Xenococcaceae cyanobacterium MO_188.B29]